MGCNASKPVKVELDPSAAGTAEVSNRKMSGSKKMSQGLAESSATAVRAAQHGSNFVLGRTAQALRKAEESVLDVTGQLSGSMPAKRTAAVVGATMAALLEAEGVVRQQVHDRSSGAKHTMQTSLDKAAALRRSLEKGAAATFLAGAVDSIQRLTHDDGSEVVNGYKLRKQTLGAGSFGRVVKATKGGETYAVKVLQRSKLTDKSRALRRPSAAGGMGSASGGAGSLDAILLEVAVMKALEHVNLVKLFAFIDDAVRATPNIPPALGPPLSKQ
jgi:hypothetical protein